MEETRYGTYVYHTGIITKAPKENKTNSGIRFAETVIEVPQDRDGQVMYGYRAVGWKDKAGFVMDCQVGASVKIQGYQKVNIWERGFSVDVSVQRVEILSQPPRAERDQYKEPQGPPAFEDEDIPF